MWVGTVLYVLSNEADNSPVWKIGHYAPSRCLHPTDGVRIEGESIIISARTASSRFTSAFEDTVAWLALHICRSALAELMRVDWRTVGGICARVRASLEEADGRGRFDGLRSIGVDETSYKKGHKHMTVIVDHDWGCVVWAAKGHGKAQLNAFLDLLADEQRSAIEVVTANGRPPDRRRRRREAARRRAGRRPLPRRQLSDRRPRRSEEARLERGEAGAGAQAPPRPAEEGRADPSRPREPHSLPAEGGAACRFQGRSGQSGGRAQPLARVGVPVPHPGVRRAVEEGQAQARRHPQVDRARRLQRPRRGGEQQDQGGGQAGLRVPQHRQPHSPRDAEVLGS